MMKITVKDFAETCGGKVIRGAKETEILSIAIDSRQVGPGALFVPIVGERTDAHRYIRKAFSAGAAAALTQEPEKAAGGAGALIAVQDTREALRKAAAVWRRRFRGPVVGITGSVGKTTTKEMTALAVSSGMRVVKTEGNQNSQIGLPLTMFRLSPEYDAAVIEMGMSEFGEMSRIAAVAAPDYAVMTNIGLSHIGNLGSRENIRAEKLHITDCFHEGSVLFLNGDDPMLMPLHGKMPFRTVCYGTRSGCDFRAENIRLGEKSCKFQAKAPDGKSAQVTLPVPGIHSVLDALAGLAVSFVLGVPLEKAAIALSGYRTPSMRMQIRKTGAGITVIDDSYNSSPDAAKSSIDVLCGFRSGRRIAVLADMLELGKYSRQGHFEVGAFAAKAGVNALVTVGTEAKAIADGAHSVNPDMECHVCENNAEAILALKKILLPGDTVLIKGSHSTNVSEIVSELLTV